MRWMSCTTRLPATGATKETAHPRHGLDLATKKRKCAKIEKKKRFIYNVRLLGDKYQMYFVGRGRHDGPEDFANRFSAKLL